MVIALKDRILYGTRKQTRIMLEDITLHSARKYQPCTILKRVYLALSIKAICIYDGKS